jgi:catechol 2,3-dioxygenase-like lactoylglutathione lyase family enzyme
MNEAKGRGIHPSLTCNDLQASVDFYTKVLGFREGEHWEQDGVLAGVVVHFGEIEWYLNRDDWKRGHDRQKGEGFRLYVDVEGDLDALAAGIKARGGTLTMEPDDRPWGVRDFSLVDPSGFKITFGKDLS